MLTLMKWEILRILLSYSISVRCSATIMDEDSDATTTSSYQLEMSSTSEIISIYYIEYIAYNDAFLGNMGHLQ